MWFRIMFLANPAAAVDNLEVARCLLEAGASTEATQAGTQNRALHLAAFQGSCSVLSILLQVRFWCIYSLLCFVFVLTAGQLSPLGSIATALLYSSKLIQLDFLDTSRIDVFCVSLCTGRR